MRRVLITFVGRLGESYIDRIASAIEVLLESNRAAAIVGQLEDDNNLYYISRRTYSIRAFTTVSKN